MNRTNFDTIQERSHQANDKLNGVHNVRTYQSHLKRQRTDNYRVLADGTIAFIRTKD